MFPKLYLGPMLTNADLVKKLRIYHDPLKVQKECRLLLTLLLVCFASLLSEKDKIQSSFQMAKL